MKKEKRITLYIVIIIIFLIFMFLLFGNVLSEQNHVAVLQEDKTSPSIVNATIFSSNKLDRYSAVVGDVITIEMNFDEPLVDFPKVEVNGKELNVVSLKDSYFVVYRVEEQYENDVAFNFVISDYKDKHGNVGQEVSTTTDLSHVVIKGINSSIEKVNIKNVYFKEEKINLLRDDVVDLEYVIEPSNAVYDRINWKSSDSSIVFINDGNVRALNYGCSTITLTVDNFTDNLEVCVNKEKVKVQKVSFDKTDDTMFVGENKKLSLKVTPNNATYDSVKWSSSDNNIASVSGGVIYAKRSGKVKITADVDGVKCSKEIVIKNKAIQVNGIKLNVSSFNMNKGDKYSLIASVSPSNANNKKIIWTSSNTNVVTVDNGVVVAKAKGTAKITAKTEDGGYSAVATVVVGQKVESISLDATSGEIYLNKTNTVTLKAVISPNNADNKDVVWSSSDNNIAVVDNGVVSAKRPGIVKITAQSVDGNKTASYTLTVKKKIILVVGSTHVNLMKSVYTKYSNNGYNYSVADNTLKYISDPDSGIAFQISGEGAKSIKVFIEDFKDSKEYVDFYIFFQMPGNEAKTLDCSNISYNSQNISNTVNGYNAVVSFLKNSGYRFNVVVVSIPPVIYVKNNRHSIVDSLNANSCKANYISNNKYNLYNEAIRVNISKQSTNLMYESLFTEFIDNSKRDLPFNETYKRLYRTIDGFLWDKNTTIMYTELMFKKSGVF